MMGMVTRESMVWGMRVFRRMVRELWPLGWFRLIRKSRLVREFRLREMAREFRKMREGLFLEFRVRVRFVAGFVFRVILFLLLFKIREIRSIKRIRKGVYDIFELFFHISAQSDWIKGKAWHRLIIVATIIFKSIEEGRGPRLIVFILQREVVC